MKYLLTSPTACAEYRAFSLVGPDSVKGRVTGGLLHLEWDLDICTCSYKDDAVPWRQC